MNTGARLALAVTAGYLLGRFRKMRWALTLAAMAGRRQLAGGKGGLLQQGVKLLSSSPEFAAVTDEMRDRLVDAGKAAAVAAVSNKINSLSDGLRERSDAMRALDVGEEEEDGEERYSDEDRAAESKPKRQHTEEDGGRVPEQRHAPSRGDSERARASQQSRTKDDKASRTRASHPSGNTGTKARSGAGARQSRGSGQSPPRALASRKGGDSE